MAEDQNVRVTYPLSDQDIKELEQLEEKLKEFAEAAEGTKRVALHGVYSHILKFAGVAIARAKARSTREANADLHRRHKNLRKTVKQEALAGSAGSANGAGATP